MRIPQQKIETRDAIRRSQTCDYSFEVRAVGAQGEVEGYGSVFNTLDSYSDIVAPGAFAASLAEHKASNSMPAMLWQHDPSDPCGVWDEMKEDARGLFVKGRLLLDVEAGAKVHTLLKAKAISGLSIGFRSRKWSWDEASDVRTLTDIELWEVSWVTFPANPAAGLTGVKSADALAVPKDAEKTLRDAGFSKSDATAFVSRVMRMGEKRSESAADLNRALASANRLEAILKSKN